MSRPGTSRVNPPRRVPTTFCELAKIAASGRLGLDDNQPYFAYASVDLSQEEATEIVSAARKKYHIQAPELKAGLLRKRENWPQIALDILNPLKERVMIVAADKRLNLGGKTFEYIFEPVLEKQCALFYYYDLHRFLMHALHRVFFKAGGPVPKLSEEFQAFMKSFDPADAPTVFVAAGEDAETDEILNCVLRFARGYAGIIAKQNETLRKDVNPVGKWTLDLTTTCLCSLILHGWGHRYESLDVLCDDSKPLQATAHILNGFVGNTRSSDVVGGGGKVERIAANLANPVRFGSSADNPTLQIADIVAGATTDLLQHQKDPAYRELAHWIIPHLHPHTMLADDDFIDLKQPKPRINLAALKELARRADAGEDPLDGMREFYEGLVAEENKKLKWRFK